MFDKTFDVSLCIILTVCGVLLVTGNGKFLLNLFRGKSQKGKPLPYEEKKLGIGSGILCFVMALAMLVLIFFPEEPLFILLAMGVVLVAFVVVIRYLRKHAKVEIEPDRTISNKIKDLSKRK